MAETSSTLITVESPTNKPLLITIPFDEYVDLEIKFKENSTISRARGQLIAEHIDPTERFCHIEFPDNPAQSGVAILWRIHEWKNDHKRWLIVKATSEWERQYSFACKDLVVAIVMALLDHPVFADALTPEMAKSQSSKLIEKRNWEAIKKLGVEEEPLKRVMELVASKPAGK